MFKDDEEIPNDDADKAFEMIEAVVSEFKELGKVISKTTCVPMMGNALAVECKECKHLTIWAGGDSELISGGRVANGKEPLYYTTVAELRVAIRRSIDACKPAKPKGKKRKPEDDICPDEPGDKLGDRLAARSKKAKKAKQDALWPELLKRLNAAANGAGDTAYMSWLDMGIDCDDYEEIEDSPIFKALKAKCIPNNIKVTDGADPIEFRFGSS